MLLFKKRVFLKSPPLLMKDGFWKLWVALLLPHRLPYHREYREVFHLPFIFLVVTHIIAALVFTHFLAERLILYSIQNFECTVFLEREHNYLGINEYLSFKSPSVRWPTTLTSKHRNSRQNSQLSLWPTTLTTQQPIFTTQQPIFTTQQPIFTTQHRISFRC